MSKKKKEVKELAEFDYSQYNVGEKKNRTVQEIIEAGDVMEEFKGIEKISIRLHEGRPAFFADGEDEPFALIDHGAFKFRMGGNADNMFNFVPFWELMEREFPELRRPQPSAPSSRTGVPIPRRIPDPDHPGEWLPPAPKPRRRK